MTDNDSKIWDHYQKLQESLSELLSPEFPTYNRSLTYITLNQIYSHTESLFELVESSTTLSRPKQALIAKLAHHIEMCKDRGLQNEFLNFVKKDVLPLLRFIKTEFTKEFNFAS